MLLLQVDLHDGSLNILSDVDNLLESGHAKCDVLAGDTGKVECVERHLSCRFAQAVGSN